MYKIRSTVLESFEAKNETQLSVTVGDEVEVIEVKPDGWVLCAGLNDVKRGCVPRSHLSNIQTNSVKGLKSMLEKRISVSSLPPLNPSSFQQQEEPTQQSTQQSTPHPHQHLFQRQLPQLPQLPQQSPGRKSAPPSPHVTLNQIGSSPRHNSFHQQLLTKISPRSQDNQQALQDSPASLNTPPQSTPPQTNPLSETEKMLSPRLISPRQGLNQKSENRRMVTSDRTNLVSDINDMLVKAGEEPPLVKHHSMPDLVSGQDLSQREKIVKEIFETEETYVKYLEILVNVFYKPLVVLSKASMGKRVLKEKAIKAIFSNVEQILALNKMLLGDMRSKKPMGETFKTLAPCLIMYTSYVNNYNTAFAEYTKNLNKKPRFSSFLKEQHESGKCEGYFFKDLLILPIQRIPRYKMLIEELLKCTDPNHSEHKQLKESLASLSNIASSINEKKREDEALPILKELQSKIGAKHPEFIQPYRKFIREKTVYISCPTQFFVKEKFAAYLLSDVLVLIQSSDSSKMYFLYFAVAHLHTFDETSKDIHLEVPYHGSRTHYSIHFDNTKDSSAWHNDVNNCINQIHTNLSTKGIYRFGEAKDSRVKLRNNIRVDIKNFEGVKIRMPEYSQKVANLTRQLNGLEEEMRKLMAKIATVQQELDAETQSLNSNQRAENNSYDNIHKVLPQLQECDKTLFTGLNQEMSVFLEIFGEAPCLNNEHQLVIEWGRTQRKYSNNSIFTMEYTQWSPVLVGDFVKHISTDQFNLEKYNDHFRNMSGTELGQCVDKSILLSLGLSSKDAEYMASKIKEIATSQTRRVRCSFKRDFDN